MRAYSVFGVFYGERLLLGRTTAVSPRQAINNVRYRLQVIRDDKRNCFYSKEIHRYFDRFESEEI